MRTSPSPSSTYKVGSGLGMLLLACSAAGRSTSCIQNQDPRHSKSLSPLRCHIVTPSTAGEVVFWQVFWSWFCIVVLVPGFGTRAMQSDLEWRESRYMSPYGPWTRSKALKPQSRGHSMH